MSKPVAITDSQFASEVLESDKPVLVDFWATWCGPCKMIAPVLDELATAHADKLKIAKLDVDANQQTAQQFGVMSIPTLILFKGGKPVDKIVGFKAKQALEAQLLPHL
ncbi:MAG: thioredoxin [bacterium]|nr:thioredoxin [bacterium]